MKSLKKTTLLFIVFIATNFNNAQVVESLYLEPSAKQNGMGMTGVALPTEDPSGFYYNPAQLGYTSQTNNISFQAYPSGTDWLKNAVHSSIAYRNTSFNLGYNFENLLKGIKLSAGFGFIHSKFDQGNFNVAEPGSPVPSSSFNQYDEYNAYGLGIGIDYFVKLNFGLTYKKITSQLGMYTTNSFGPYKINTSAIDLGFLATLPVERFFANRPKLKIDSIKIFPYCDFSLGYSKLNIGDEVSFADPTQKDALPRIARLGYSMSIGLNAEINKATLKIIGYDFTAEADDYLVKIEDTAPSKPSYQGFLGDISIGRNLVGLKSSDNVAVHKGHNINLFETVSFQLGRFDGHGYYNEKTSGIGVQAKGVFTLIKGYTSNTIINFIADHLDIQYYATKVFVDDPRESRFETINIIWSGMML